MLTITTSKEEVAAIAKGDITQKALPLSDFWKKRIVNLLGNYVDGERNIIYNLRNDMKGTTDAAREVRFTAGGAANARVMATFKIGRINPEAAETFILTVKEVLETFGINDTSGIEVVEGEVIDEATVAEVEGMPSAPVLRTTSKHTGFCKFCNQAVMFDAQDGLSSTEYNELASIECNCTEALYERGKRQKIEAAGEWAKGTFSKSDKQLQLALHAISAAADKVINYVTIKIEKNTYKIDRDGDGMIRIRTTYKDTDEETF